jgi:hypothetical protein
MIWLGELPKALRKPTSEACLNSTEMRSHGHRRLVTSYYDGTRTAGECSNHYIKMPATLAALAHPEIKGLYYVDLDSVARYPWIRNYSHWTTSKRLREHENNFSDVSFHPIGLKGWRKRSLRWHVFGSRYYARDSVQGRAFFASWFNNRCTFKDQYSLWHTILEFAAAEGCVPYDGEIFRLTYGDVRSMGHTDKASLTLDCDTIDARCPGFRYSNRGGDTCDTHVPHLLDNLYHSSIGTDGQGILRLVLEGGFTLSLENACFAGTSSKCEVASDVSEYAALLGVAGRDRSLHPWNSTAANAPIRRALASAPHVGSAQAEASKRDMWRPVLAELDRSLDRLEETLPPVEGDQASWLARTLHHWDGGSSVLVLEGRAYVSERFAGRDLTRTAKNSA